MTSPGDRPNFERGEQPPQTIDLLELQNRFPNPEDADIIGLCNAIVEEASYNPEQRLKLKLDLYGSADHKNFYRAMSGPSLDYLANSLFIDTFNREIPKAADVAQFDWRMKAFFADSILYGKYIGGKVSIGSPDDKRSDPIEVRDFGINVRKTMSLVQLAKFCEANPELTDAALNSWTAVIEGAWQKQRHQGESKVTQHQVASAVAFLLRSKELAPNQAGMQVLEKIRSSIQWERLETPPAFSSPSLKLWMSNLELMPIEQIPADEITALHDELTSDKFDPKMPFELINSSLIATQNVLKSLVTTRQGYNSLTGLLLKSLEAYSGDNPLGYSDMTSLANLLTKMLQARGLDVKNLTPEALEDYPKAVDRILYVVLAEKNDKLTASGQLERYKTVADCIKREAFKGVEGKLGQRVLTLGDFAIRYTELSAKQRQYYMRKLIAKQITEAELEAATRQIPENKPFSPGWGKAS